MPQLVVDGLLAQTDRQNRFAPRGIKKGGRMAAHSQANHEVDADLHQVFQQFQVAEFPVEHQWLIAQERLDLVKGFPMIPIK